MSKIRIELNSAGVRELLRSQSVADVLAEHAAAIAGRCGEGYAHDTHMTPGRVVASAYTETPEAMADNLRENTLLRAMQ